MFRQPLRANTSVDRMFGLEGGYGQETMGLSETAAQDVITQVGNYGQIYDRHLTPLGLERAGSRNAALERRALQRLPEGWTDIRRALALTHSR